MKRTELPPPTCYMKILLSPEVEDAYHKVCEVLTSSIDVLSKQEALTMEAYVLSRMLYKLNSQWRREKSLQGLKRVRSCLDRYSEMKVMEYMKELKDHFDGCNLYIGEIYLPTRQMIVYLLKQIMCIAGLMSRLSSYCQHSYIYISQHLAIGNFLPQNMILLSLVSRIWTLSKSLCLHSVKWYDDIGMVDIFPQTQVSSEDKVELPKDLTAFLNIHNDMIECADANILDANNQTRLDDFNESFDEERMEMDDSIDSDEEPKTIEKISINKKDITEKTVTPSDDSLGCEVSRQDTKLFTNDHTPGSVSGMMDFDEGCAVDRDIINPSTEASHTFDMIEFKLNVEKCKSFKMIKQSLRDLEQYFRKNDRLISCSSHIKRLKKEHLQLKRAGKKNNKFIDQAKYELKKIVDLENNALCINKSSEHTRLKDRSHDCVKQKSLQNDFDIDDIFKKPFKSLGDLVNRHCGTNKSKEKMNKKRIKSCALTIKVLKKSYMEENKKKYIKKARKEVNNLLATIV